MTHLPSAYRPDDQAPHSRRFVAVEGVSGCGKTTLVRHLGAELPAATLHTIPQPLSKLSGWVNGHCLPLPQLAFYLTGLLHASDSIRAYLPRRHVVADRYATSVIANHAAVNGIEVRKVQEMLHPFTPYLVRPGITLYLHTSASELRRRMADKPDLSPSDRHLLDNPQVLTRLVSLYVQFAEDDPNAVGIVTDGMTIAEVADTAWLAVKERAC
ncbi:thymidylate kinase [Streptacidiphilus sp. MAP12-16]|uniref:dTMP kinase n=1 Tax=Streptacidiphilus sp. MAP12-16 TaxID=3156300 RepID=UPI0035193EF0